MRSANEISLLNTDQCLLWNSNVLYPQVRKHFPHFAHILSTRMWNAAFLKEIQNIFSYMAFDSVLKLSYCLISDFSRKDNIVFWSHPPSLSVRVFLSFILSDHVKNFSLGTWLPESVGMIYTANYYTTYCSSLWNADVEELCCRW